MLFLLILLLPSQLAYHFWPSWSLVNGIRVDYLSPTIYLTDILIIGLWMAKKIRPHTTPLPPPTLGGGVRKTGVVFIIFVVLNILISSSPLVSLFKWIRLLEYYWLYKYLVSIQHSAFSLRFPLSIAVFWTSLLAWIQFIKQSSLGGLAWWLGERNFSVSTPGIAKIQIFNNWLTGQLGTGVLLRAYATLPHPNALAGFLLVGMLIIYFFYTSPLRPSPNIGEGFRGRGLGLLAIIIAALTIPLTFSRTTIVLEILILIIWTLFKIVNSKFKIIAIVTLTLLLFYSFTLITGSSDSIPDRISLGRTAISIIKHSPLLGVGLGAFIPSSLNFTRQPVHNIYLLLASELGLPAALAIGYWLLAIRKKLLNIEHCTLNIAILVVLTTGLVDHYWLTLHQNSLLLVVLLAVIKVQSMTTNDNV